MTEQEKREVAKKIRKDYIVAEKTNDEFDSLVSLNKKATQKPMIIALITGIIGALIAGLGMSLIMTDLGNKIGVDSSLALGIIIGIAGLFICCINYPLYKKSLKSRKEKYAAEIIRLSDEFLK